MEDRNRRFHRIRRLSRFNRRQIIRARLQTRRRRRSVIVAALGKAVDVAAAAGSAAGIVRPARPPRSTAAHSPRLALDGASDIDPHSTYNTQGGTITFVCYEMLIKYKDNSTSDFEPMLASSWTASPDNKTYTFTTPVRRALS